MKALEYVRLIQWEHIAPQKNAKLFASPHHQLHTNVIDRISNAILIKMVLTKTCILVNLIANPRQIGMNVIG
jgi:hypothetical protein